MTAETGITLTTTRVKAGRKVQHGMSRDPIYRIWQMIIRRTTEPKCDAYPKYGGRGIKICNEWLNSFEAFTAHIGPRPSPLHSVDRIENDKSYEPGNVRWALKKMQARNRRTNRFLELNGERKTVAEWAEVIGCKPIVLYLRLRAGWSDSDTICVAIRKLPPRKKNPPPVKGEDELF